MKKFLAALLALVMVLSLAACGGGSDSTGGSGDSSTPPPASSDAGDSGSSGGSSEKIDINVIAAQYGQNTGDWWAKFQEDFNKEHEDINLTVEVVSWNDIYTVVNTRISGNAAPDILKIDTFADSVGDDLLRPI